jgi:hypothetical protein
VATGELAIEIMCPVTIQDTAPGPPPYMVADGATVATLDWNATTTGPTFKNNPVQTDKNVAWVTTNCDEVIPPRKEITMTFHNVYPCYWNHISFGINNYGTIPAKLDHVVFKDSTEAVIGTLTEIGYLVFDLSGNGVDDFEIYWGDNFGDQIHTSESWDISFWIHFMQDEEIDFSVPHSYTLTIEVVAVQWNEYPLP